MRRSTLAHANRANRVAAEPPTAGELGLPEEFWQIHGPTIREIATKMANLPDPVDRHVIASFERALELASDPLQRAVVARAMDAAIQLSARLDPTSSAHVLSNESGRDVLLDLIEHTPIDTGSAQHDLIQGARVRGLRMRSQILEAEGGVWRAEEVGAHLAISRQAVERRRQRGQLIGLPIGGKGYAYPRWQFDTDGMLPGFVETLAALTIPGAWTRAAFFLGANTLLGGVRPLDALREGYFAEVERAAASFGEQVAV
jgi:hypothetical protein